MSYLDRLSSGDFGFFTIFFRDYLILSVGGMFILSLISAPFPSVPIFFFFSLIRCTLLYFMLLSIFNYSLAFKILLILFWIFLFVLEVSLFFILLFSILNFSDVIFIDQNNVLTINKIIEVFNV